MSVLYGGGAIAWQFSESYNVIFLEKLHKKNLVLTQAYMDYQIEPIWKRTGNVCTPKTKQIDKFKNIYFIVAY
jgi:hypothetical protein